MLKLIYWSINDSNYDILTYGTGDMVGAAAIFYSTYIILQKVTPEIEEIILKVIALDDLLLSLSLHSQLNSALQYISNMK